MFPADISLHIPYVAAQNISLIRQKWHDPAAATLTRWLYCAECQQYSIRLEALGYLCASCLLPAFDAA